MRFALLGDHPDGLDMARALVETGRHELAMYSGPAAGAEMLSRWGIRCPAVADMEEALADPAVEAVIVAGKPAGRPEQLRRALQSERHVLCVMPVDTSPDTAYEAALIQGDTKQVLFPLLPEALHPGVVRLAELARVAAERRQLRLVEMERWSPDRVLVEAGVKRAKTSLPGWDVLRSLGGEIAEVLGLASREVVEADEPLLLMGRFETGALFQATYLAGQHEARWRLGVVTRFGRAELDFAQGWPGPARLTWLDEAGDSRVEEHPLWNPWPALVAVLEEEIAGVGTAAPRGIRGTRLSSEAGIEKHFIPEPTGPGAGPASTELGSRRKISWQDAVRLLELDDAARRSVEKRRASTLEYQEATEEAGFKGLMTLFGCGLLWASIGLLILSRWFPWAGWLIPPLFAIFLAMQLLRWGLPKPPAGGEPGIRILKEPESDSRP